MPKDQPWSAHWATWTPFNYRIAYVSLGLLSQKSYAPSLGTLQTSLYSWYLFTTLDTANTRTILALHAMIK